jgi:biotin transport system ATP-binding protein
VGFLFQNPDAKINMPTVAEDVAIGFRNRGYGSEEVAQRVRLALERYGLWQHRDQPAHLLSGGEKQILALCAVTAIEPRYLVLDEPTTLLDRKNTRRVADVLRDLLHPLVIVTHDADLAIECDRVLLLEDGGLVADGPPDKVLPSYLRIVEA